MLANWLYKNGNASVSPDLARWSAVPRKRYYVGQLFGVTVYLHRFVGCDGDPELHDHPWNALSIVLSGSYIELRGRLDGDVGIAKRRVMVKFWELDQCRFNAQNYVLRAGDMDVVHASPTGKRMGILC